MIKVVFLDIDDTLLSFSGYVKEAMRSGFAEFGLKPYEESMYDVFRETNDILWRRIEQGSLTYEELMKIRWNTIFEQLDIRFDGETFEQYFKDRLFTSAIPVPGARAMLEYLKDRYTLCVASNGPYEQQLNRLRLADMEKYFAHVFVSSKVGASKPGREFFDACFDMLRSNGFQDLRPEETFIIGDSMSSDIAGGAAYGMHTCLYHPADAPQMDTSGAEFVVTDLQDMMQLL